MLISSLRQRRATFIRFFWGEVEDISEAEIYGNIFNVVCEWKLH